MKRSSDRAKGLKDAIKRGYDIDNVRARIENPERNLAHPVLPLETALGNAEIAALRFEIAERKYFAGELDD